MRDDLASVGARYLGMIDAPEPGISRVIDKMPTNFLRAGFIHLMLPRARIIHCRREPSDTCLSCYSKLFTNGQEFSYDMRELGTYYCDYARLMSHWRAVLPPERFFEVDYEAVVIDFEQQIRRLIAFCGLPWDDACVRFHETKRTIRTASKNQVRRPLYGSSIGRWKHFEAQLGPLIEALSER
jgi:hypothetical protein